MKIYFKFLPKRGLEPLLLKELEPKPSMSTNSIILANRYCLFVKLLVTGIEPIL